MPLGVRLRTSIKNAVSLAGRRRSTRENGKGRRGEPNSDERGSDRSRGKKCQLGLRKDREEVGLKKRSEHGKRKKVDSLRDFSNDRRSFDDALSSKNKLSGRKLGKPKLIVFDEEDSRAERKNVRKVLDGSRRDRSGVKVATGNQRKRMKVDSLQDFSDDRRSFDALSSKNKLSGRKFTKPKLMLSDKEDSRREGKSVRKVSHGSRIDRSGVRKKTDDTVTLDVNDAVLVENNEGKETDQVAEQKHRRLPTRVLDKTGKMIRIIRKGSDSDSTATGAPKKRKRVIKIDRYDDSNKRLDDTPTPTSIATEKVQETKIEMSKNAQFRAIQPSSSIMSFVENNLLGRRRLIELKNAGYNVKLSAPLDNIPFSSSSEREKIEENVFRNKLEFFAAAKISSSFPPPLIPEIAFAGRSNVGKSSLLNALTRQWGVVRTSDKPGLTQTINFFQLASKLCLVDLPGYGFAYAKEEVKDAWEELVKEYVSTRVGLQRVCLLIDTKWGMKPRDQELINLMERSQTPFQIVLTKTDVVFPIDVARRAMQIQESLKKNKSVVNPMMIVSSKSGAGIRSLRTALAKLARFVKP